MIKDTLVMPLSKIVDAKLNGPWGFYADCGPWLDGLRKMRVDRQSPFGQCGANEGNEAMIPTPAWIFVNTVTLAPDESQYPMTRGGGPYHPGSVDPPPEALLVFTSRELAERIVPGAEPVFKLISVSTADLRKLLDGRRNIDSVLVDMGTEDAEMYRAEKVLMAAEPPGQ